VTRPTYRKPEKPVFWIVAGPNGCGKSSLYNRTDIEGWGGSVWIINPDLLTAMIVESEQLGIGEANLEAVRRIETWLESSLQTYQTIGVETVLSTGKYRRLVELARERGFRVRLLYVVLSTIELQLARIRDRVKNGGHDVPADKVRTRRQGSFEQLAWFLHHVDDCFIYDNSDGSPSLAAAWDGGALNIFASLPPDLLVTLRDQGVKGVHHLR
jgi:predicted ABC-type ATPase